MIDRRKKYQDWHRAAGLCVSCPEKATHGIKCRKHWLMNKRDKKKYRNKIKAQRRETGKCITCGITLDPEIDTGATCINCGGESAIHPRPQTRRNYR